MFLSGLSLSMHSSTMALVTMDCIGTTVTMALSAADLGMQMDSWASKCAEVTGMTKVVGSDDSMILVADFACIGCVALLRNSVEQWVGVIAAMVERWI